jgi:hypothetical protein
MGIVNQHFSAHSSYQPRWQQSIEIVRMDGIASGEQQKDEKPQIQINIEKRPRIKPQFESFGFVGQIER